MFLVAHSKWSEVVIMTNTATSETTAVLHDLLARNGISWRLVPGTHRGREGKLELSVLQ